MWITGWSDWCRGLWRSRTSIFPRLSVVQRHQLWACQGVLENAMYVIITSSEPTHTSIEHHTSRIMMGLCFCRVPWSTRGPKGVVKSHWQGHSSRGNVLSWWIWGFEWFVVGMLNAFPEPMSLFNSGSLDCGQLQSKCFRVSQNGPFLLFCWYDGFMWDCLQLEVKPIQEACVSTGWCCFLLQVLRFCFKWLDVHVFSSDMNTWCLLWRGRQRLRVCVWSIGFYFLCVV